MTSNKIKNTNSQLLRDRDFSVKKSIALYNYAITEITKNGK